MLARLCSLAAIAFLGSNATASAMTMRVVHDQAILRGTIVDSDVEHFRKLIAANPAITTVVLQDSPGGAFAPNQGLSKIIADAKLTTAVAGHCVSACAMVFLSGTKRVFSDGEPLDLTSLGFHGSYENGSLAPEERLAYLRGVVLADTGGKADPKLVDHWQHLPSRNLTVRFRYPGVDVTAKAPTVFDCTDSGPNGGDYSRCSPIAGPNALSMGIITSTTILHVALP